MYTLSYTEKPLFPYSISRLKELFSHPPDPGEEDMGFLWVILTHSFPFKRILYFAEKKLPKFSLRKFGLN
jgi:hypothetical protein